MSRVLKPLILSVLLFSLPACLQRPVFTLEIFETPTRAPATASISTGPTSTATLPPLPVPATRPVFTSTPDGTFSPVLLASKDSDTFMLLGGVKTERGWLSAEDAAAYVTGGLAYEFFGAGSPVQARGGALEAGATCRGYFMRSDSPMPDRMVGMARGWGSQPRMARELAADDPAYILAVREWFQSQGNNPAEIRISRILQADLEGDGINEILLSASYFRDGSGHMSETGDYSVVLMRRVVGNDVLTVPLIADYYISDAPELSYPRRYTIGSAVDLNRNGTLEVVVDVSRWEGGGAIVFQVDGRNVREVMRAIC